MAKYIQQLRIQYLHGRLSAAIESDNELLRFWEYPEVITDLEQLRNALELIPPAVYFQGKEVSLLLADPSIEYNFFKVPPMKKANLIQFLTRKVQMSPTEKGNRIWGWTALEPFQKQENICLHLAPDAFLTLFLSFCSKHNFQPYHLFPIAALLPLLLEFAEGKEDDLELVAATVGDSTFLVIGRKNAPYLIREVPCSWSSEDGAAAGRLNREIQRTVLFTKQQYDKEIVQIRLCGKNAGAISSLVNTSSGLPVTVDDKNIQWLKFFDTLSPYRTDNLLPPQAIHHIHRRKLSILLSVALFFLVCLSVSMELLRHNLIEQSKVTVADSQVENDITFLTARKTQLEKRQAIISRQVAIAAAIAQKTAEPVPGWFSGVVGDMIPDGLILTRLSVNQDASTGGWLVEIEGAAPRNPLLAAHLLKQFQERLSGNPSFLAVKTAWQLQWIENLKTGGTADSDNNKKTFRIYGRIR